MTTVFPGNYSSLTYCVLFLIEIHIQNPYITVDVQKERLVTLQLFKGFHVKKRNSEILKHHIKISIYRDFQFYNNLKHSPHMVK